MPPGHVALSRPWPRRAAALASSRPAWPGAAPAGPSQAVEAEIRQILAPRWLDRVMTWQLAGEKPARLRLRIPTLRWVIRPPGRSPC